MSTSKLAIKPETVKLGSPLPSAYSVFQERKSETARLADLLAPNPLRSNICFRLTQCAGLLAFTKPTTEWKLFRASFCRVRFCPMCQMRRSRKWLAKFYDAAPTIQKIFPTDRFLLLTLTLRNPQARDLRENLLAMSAGWKRLTLLKSFTGVRGFIRSTELTKGKDGTTHPHYHVLLQVKPSYFSTGYVTQADWVQNWRKAMRLDYDPVVDIRRVKPVKDAPDGLTASLAGAVEVLKYTTKGSDLLEDANWTDTVMTQTNNMRFLGTGGCWKNVMADNADEDLDKEETTEEENTDPVWLWGFHQIARKYESVGLAERWRAVA